MGRRTGYSESINRTKLYLASDVGSVNVEQRVRKVYEAFEEAVNKMPMYTRLCRKDEFPFLEQPEFRSLDFPAFIMKAKEAVAYISADKEWNNAITHAASLQHGIRFQVLRLAREFGPGWEENPKVCLCENECPSSKVSLFVCCLCSLV